MSIANIKIVYCPICEDTMVQRKGARGPFWSCSRFPQCRGTRNIGDEEKVADTRYQRIEKMSGSTEQEAIWAHMLNPNAGHLVINAGPGTGKTWSSIQGCLRLPKTKKIFFVAFNVHIAKEANGKLAASGCGNVEAMTFHGLGWRILRQNFRGVQINEHKMTEILEWLSPQPLINLGEWRRGLNLAKRLCAYVKNYNLDYTASNFKDELERVAQHHGLELNGLYPTALKLVAPALDECKKRAGVSCDFDDQIWLPIVLDLHTKYPADIIITDESQDLNVVQHELIFRAAKPETRVFVVGDRRQSMYGFRGADTLSMDKLRDRLAATKLGVTELPLTITRRCPKSHVKLAAAISPEIQALEDAPEGEILSLPYAKAVEEMKVGDLVLCRVNAEIVQCAYALIWRKIRPQVKGRDIGEGLISLLDKLAKDVDPDNEMPSLNEALNRYLYAEEAKLAPLGDRAEARLMALHDKIDCMREFIANSNSVADMRSAIDSLFERSTDNNAPINAVTLGTVHRTKGLEAERVFVLAPQLIPHPASKQPWERQQEANIAWVAATRAKFNKDTGAPGTLVFCGLVPAIYRYRPPQPPSPKAEEPVAGPPAPEKPSPKGEAPLAPPPAKPSAPTAPEAPAKAKATAPVKRTLPNLEPAKPLPGKPAAKPAKVALKKTVTADDEPPF